MEILQLQLTSFILQRASDQSHTCKWKRMYTTRPTGETNDGSLPLINRVSNYLIRWMLRRSDFSLKREVRDINEGSIMFSYLTSQTQCGIKGVHLPGMFCKCSFKSSELLDSSNCIIYWSSHYLYVKHLRTFVFEPCKKEKICRECWWFSICDRIYHLGGSLTLHCAQVSTGCRRRKIINGLISGLNLGHSLPSLTGLCLGAKASCVHGHYQSKHWSLLHYLTVLCEAAWKMSQMTNVAHNEHLECEVKATHSQNNRKHPHLGFIVFFNNICILF